MRLVWIALAVAITLDGQSPVQVKTGALTCGAIRRASVNGLVNVQTYCYAGTPVISNMSSLIPPAGAIVVSHCYAADNVVWKFTDAGAGVITYQVSTGGANLKQGNLP